MIDFLQAKAKELGAQNCPHCGNVDYGFGMAGAQQGGGACINCQGDVQKYTPLKTMHFSLAVYRELVAKYDDLQSSPDIDKFRRNLVGTLDNFLEPIIYHNSLPSDDDIIVLQDAIKTMKVVIGSEKKLGGGITLDFGKIGLAFSKANITKDSGKVLGVNCLAIDYILKYPAVPTPFSLPAPKATKKGFFARLFS
jgi:hypothetical protein